MERSGRSRASAPKAQSSIRKPVKARAAQEPGWTTLATVPSGAVTSMARSTPSLFGMSAGKTVFSAVKQAALVTESVALMAPRTCGAVPDQSKAIRSPRLRRVTKRRIGWSKIDAVVVDPVLEVHLAVRKLADRRASHSLGIVGHLVHVDLRRLDAVLLDQLGQLTRGDLAGGELRAQIAEDLHRNADVLLDKRDQCLVEFAAGHQLERRDAQAFLIDLGRVRGIGAGHAAADVGLVRRGRGEGHTLSANEDRLEDEDVGQVHAALEGIVHDEDVVFLDVAFEDLDDPGERRLNRTQVHGHGEPLGHDAPAGVG